MVNISTSLNELKTKVDGFYTGHLKTVLVNWKKMVDVVSKEVVKVVLVFTTLNAKVSNLEKKIPDTSTLIQTSQYNTGKRNLKNKIRDAENKTPDIGCLASTSVLGENENKIPNTSALATGTVLDVSN